MRLARSLLVTSRIFSESAVGFVNNKNITSATTIGECHFISRWADGGQSTRPPSAYTDVGPIYQCIPSERCTTILHTESQAVISSIIFDSSVLDLCNKKPLRFKTKTSIIAPLEFTWLVSNLKIKCARVKMEIYVQYIQITTQSHGSNNF